MDKRKGDGLLLNRRFWIGVLITAGFLALLIVRVGPSRIGTALADANYLYVAPGIAVYFVSLYFRSYRWRYLLRPFQVIPTRRLYPVVAVGYMANNILPLRLGELARSYYLARREPVQASTGLATVLTERLFDGLTLLLFFAVAAAFLPVAGLTDRISEETQLPIWLISVSAIAPFVIVLGMVITASRFPGLFIRALSIVTDRLPRSVGETASRLASRFLVGFTGLHQPKRLAAIFALSLPVWLAEATMYYIIAFGFGLQDYFESIFLMTVAMFLVTAASNLATSLPSSPGSVGPFEFFAVLTLFSLDVDAGVASAYAIVLHIALLLPVIVLGLIILSRESISLRQLTHAQETGTQNATSITEDR
ncbi:MAG: lysylphosphatidylglycerol synthase transmembrane domain-containing protein [Chloroflexi bacterium]|nr:lysylphosphatidylglycerol synthase transmembrane domain-containing protein [Chloroflexota bacterium]